MTVPGLTLVKPDEIALARDLLRQAFRDHDRGMTRLWSGGYDWLGDSIRAHHVLFWNRKTGIVVFRPGSLPDRLTIAMIGLRPDLHGYGLGQAMLYTVEREIMERGYHWAELRTPQKFGHLSRFCETQGYRCVHVGVPPDASDTEQHVFYEKPLTEQAVAAAMAPPLHRRPA